MNNEVNYCVHSNEKAEAPGARANDKLAWKRNHCQSESQTCRRTNFYFFLINELELKQQRN